MKKKITVKPKKSRKFLVDIKASKISQLGPFKGGYFSSADLEMGVRVRLREVSAYERCPLTGGVRLQEVRNVEF